MEDVSNSNEGDVHAGSEISPQLPPLQSDHQSTNDVPLSWASRPPDDEGPWHRPPSIIPPLPSSWQFESSITEQKIKAIPSIQHRSFDLILIFIITPCSSLPPQFNPHRSNWTELIQQQQIPILLPYELSPLLSPLIIYTGIHQLRSNNSMHNPVWHALLILPHQRIPENRP